MDKRLSKSIQDSSKRQQDDLARSEAKVNKRIGDVQQEMHMEVTKIRGHLLDSVKNKL